MGAVPSSCGTCASESGEPPIARVLHPRITCAAPAGILQEPHAHCTLSSLPSTFWTTHSIAVSDHAIAALLVGPTQTLASLSCSALVVFWSLWPAAIVTASNLCLLLRQYVLVLYV